MRRSRSTKSSAQCESVGLFERVAFRHELTRQLLVEIFQGELPPGTRLVVMSLASRFGLSSTPVREALLELEWSGVVQFHHNRGAVVRPLGPTQLREIFGVRRLLEVEAARLACGRVDQAAMDAMRREFGELAQGSGGRSWLQREMASDREVHSLIATSCGNTRLAEEIRRYETLFQALRDVVGDNRRATRQSVKEHLAILDALTASDGSSAAEAMGRHIDRALRSAEAALFGGRPIECRRAD
jgi:DNA-binding GntR family transcriptional regulator